MRLKREGENRRYFISGSGRLLISRCSQEVKGNEALITGLVEPRISHERRISGSNKPDQSLKVRKERHIWCHDGPNMLRRRSQGWLEFDWPGGAPRAASRTWFCVYKLSFRSGGKSEPVNSDLEINFWSTSYIGFRLLSGPWVTAAWTSYRWSTSSYRVIPGLRWPAMRSFTRGDCSSLILLLPRWRK